MMFGVAGKGAPRALAKEMDCFIVNLQDDLWSPERGLVSSLSKVLGRILVQILIRMSSIYRRCNGGDTVSSWSW